MSGGSTSTSDTTSNQINQIPAWMTQAGQQNYAYAQNVAMQPLQQYQGQMVAGVSPQMQQSWDVAANSGNVGSDQFNAATAGYLGALGQNPTSVKAGQLAGTNLQPYMNPYTQDVINATLPLMQQQNALSQNQQADAAASAKAFGGSRQGIQQGVAQAQGALNIGQMAAQLNQANFAQAQAGATGDINRTLTADTSNQQANQAKINSDILASQGLTNTGQQMNASNVANFNMLQSAGAAQEMQQQNQINAQMAKFNQAFNYPQQQLGVLESSLGMTPHDTSTSGQSNTTTTTPTDWASIIKGGADTAASLYTMSDKSMKTDIEKLGKDPDTKLPMYAYRYKGDPKTYPKVVGPMAQDVQDADPSAVKKVGKDGKLAIKVKGYAGGTAFVGQPPLTPFIPPSSPGVAKGIGFDVGVSACHTLAARRGRAEDAEVRLRDRRCPGSRLQRRRPWRSDHGRQHVRRRRHGRQDPQARRGRLQDGGRGARLWSSPRSATDAPWLGCAQHGLLPERICLRHPQRPRHGAGRHRSSDADPRRGGPDWPRGGSSRTAQHRAAERLHAARGDRNRDASRRG